MVLATPDAMALLPSAELAEKPTTAVTIRSVGALPGCHFGKFKDS